MRLAQGMKTERARSFLIFAFCFTSFSLAATAQESTYSADSLMAAFDRGSKVSLKGTEITFTGVVVESRILRVTFKSSGNDKVICELASPLDKESVALLTGSPLTVVGKVRGRGILGNVTLDRCRLALNAGLRGSDVTADASPDPVSDAIPEEPAAETSYEPPEEPAENTVKEHDAGTTTRASRSVSRKRPALTAPAPAPKTSPAAIAPDASLQEPERPNNATGLASNPNEARLRNAVYALAALLVGIGLLAFVKLRPAYMARRVGTAPATDDVKTPEMRRLALEEMLLRQKKKE